VFLILLFVVAAMNPAVNLFSQYGNSQPVLLTPNTNDLDGVSGLRAIAPPVSNLPESYNSPSFDRSNKEDREEYTPNESYYRRNRQNETNEQYNFGQERPKERVADSSGYPYRNDNYRNNNYESQNSPQGDRSIQPRRYPPESPSPNAPPQNQHDNKKRTIHTANAYPSAFDSTRELINSETRLNSGQAGLGDGFSSNHVVPFGDQNYGKLDLTATYKDELPSVRVCGVIVVQANFPLNEVELQLLEIENLQRDLNNYLGLPAPKEKIELCLFRDEESYMKFLVTKFANAPRDRRALYIKKNNAPGTVLVQRLKDFEIDLRHEMTHAIIHASIPIVPIWLDEGLAKYFEPLPQDRFNDNPYIKSVRRNMRFGTFAVPSLNRLERLAVASDMGDSEYRDSWAWVHFMFHHSEKTHRMLAGYLKLLASLPQDKYKDKNGTVKVPNLSLYLEDYVENPRQQFRKHFQKNAAR
jgi:hypothetical protein